MQTLGTNLANSISARHCHCFWQHLQQKLNFRFFNGVCKSSNCDWFDEAKARFAELLLADDKDAVARLYKPARAISSETDLFRLFKYALRDAGDMSVLEATAFDIADIAN